MNIVITGKRNSGKTTLVNDVISTLGFKTSGYRTIPYQKYDIGWSYAMESLVTFQKEAISYCDGIGMKGITETFETFGVKCLKQSFQGDDIIVLDEIGRFERHSYTFLSMIDEILRSSKFVLAVVKAEPIDYLEDIKSKQADLLIDLDQISYDYAKELILSKLKSEGSLNENEACKNNA